MEEIDGPGFMKIRFFDNVCLYFQVFFIVAGYLLLLLAIGITYLTSGINIDPANFGIDIARGKIDMRGMK